MPNKNKKKGRQELDSQDVPTGSAKPGSDELETAELDQITGGTGNAGNAGNAGGAGDAGSAGNAGGRRVLR